MWTSWRSFRNRKSACAWRARPLKRSWLQDCFKVSWLRLLHLCPLKESDSTPKPHRVRFKSSRKKEFLAKSNTMGSDRTFQLKFWCRALTFIPRVNFLSTLNPAHTSVNTVEKTTEKWLRAGLITPPPSVLQSAQSPAGTRPNETVPDPRSRPGPGGTASDLVCERLAFAPATHPRFTTPTHPDSHQAFIWTRRSFDRLFWYANSEG